MTFWACRKNVLIRKVRLLSTFMTSQPGKQRITTHILLYISQIKGNQKLKFGQLIEHPKRDVFLQKLCRKWSKETSSRSLFVFEKSFILGKSKRSAAWFHYISIALKLPCNRNKLFKTLHYWSRDILNFDFFIWGSGNSLVAFTYWDIGQCVYHICFIQRWLIG